MNVAGRFLLGLSLFLFGETVQLLGAQPPGEAFLPVPSTGKARFEPTREEIAVPQRYRLAAHEFAFETEFERASGPVHISKVRFPSPVVTESAVNNVVHAQYFQPQGTGPFPAVVVLHILGGDFPLSQMIANGLARRGVAALFVKLPYYGERREKNSRQRMLSPNLDETVAGMTQAVLDVRRAVAWLETRPEVDAKQLGIMGISLGGIMSCLAAEAEPRFRKVAAYLAGGNLHAAIWDSQISEIQDYKAQWKAAGETRETFLRKMAEVDPITFADRLKTRDVLMVAADHDEVIPKACTVALWNGIGSTREIVWLDAGHYSAARFIFGEMERLGQFFSGKSQ